VGQRLKRCEPNLCRDEASGEGVGAKMAKALDGKDYQLVITGHSLGAGTAALIGLKLKDRFPGGSLDLDAIHISAEMQVQGSHATEDCVDCHLED